MKDLCFIGLDTQHQEQDVLAFFLDESETNTTKNSAVTFQKGFLLS